METGRYAVRDVHQCHGLAFKILRIEDHKVGCFLGDVNDITHQPAIVLRRSAFSGDENKFARDMACAENVDLFPPGYQIMLE